jgi:CDP-diacylglycerol--glycerol-3-phosphate 3-phosphatidyltransferase
VLTDRARRLARPVVDPVAIAAGRLGMTPNMLSLAGVAGHVAVAWLLARGSLAAGAVALAVAAAADGLDGALARATGQDSRAGAFLDSVLDRVSEILVFGGLLAYAQSRGDARAGLLAFAALTGSLMVSYTRARSEGLQRGTHAGVFGRMERMVVLIGGLALGWVTPTLAVLAAGAWATAIWRMRDVVRRCLAEPE